jgi:hypothetical protein
LIGLGHEVNLDAGAIREALRQARQERGGSEAVARPTMRFVGVMNRSLPILRGFGFRSNEYGFSC